MGKEAANALFEKMHERGLPPRELEVEIDPELR
jgi:hypothetical protein